MSGAGGQSSDGSQQMAAAAMRSVAPACVVIYLAVVLALLFAILHRDNGVFTYTLDDPYIHLALAENLAHGHYGINPGEASSPSSSIVWPFLLVPAAGAAWGQYVPLALNVLFCGMAAWFIGRMVDGWQTLHHEADYFGWFDWAARLCVAVALMLIANLAGLTFVGMEHGLQVLLAVICAAGMLKAYGGGPIPAWCLGAAALGPMVRYENLAVVAAVAVVLYAQRGSRAAVRLVGASLVGPALFSVFLLSRGLPALPSSVLVKAGAYTLVQGGVWMQIVHRYIGTPNGTMQQWAWWSQAAVAAVLLWLAMRERQAMRRVVLWGALMTAALQLTVGSVNWFNRYEVYALAFTALVTATALVATRRINRFTLAAVLFVAAFPYARAMVETPGAASNIYQQQYQMHRFVTDFYRKPVAVNDLGWVSYRRPPGVYVLDLWGLASPEASRHTNKNVDWMETVTTAHGTGLAIIYPQWYVEGAPEEWDALGKMCITSPDVSVGLPCVSFYRTEVGDKEEIERELADFARTLPGSIRMTLGVDSSEEN